MGRQDENGQAVTFQVLLILEFLVTGDEHVKAGSGGGLHQLTILEPAPAAKAHGRNLVLRQARSQLMRDILVEQYFQRGCG